VTRGSEACDGCLRRLADALTVVVRHETVIVARCGGEEFAVILPYTDAAGARTLAEEIRARIETELGFKWDGKVVPVTVSIGVACVAVGASVDPADMIAVADEALYESKNAGRNRVTIHELDSHPFGSGVAVTP